VGSAAQLDYRALGDTINTAARLESANRHVDTRVLLSGTTVAACDDLAARPVGILLLKGKSEGIEAFEPLEGGADDTASIDQYQVAYACMASKAPDALETFEALAADSPDDRLVAFHLHRLRSGESGATIAFEEK